jgi:NADH-quinone oxidoreductase subunit L
MLFLVFHGEERIDPHAKEHLRESPAVVTVPLIALAIPSVAIGWFTIGPVLFGSFFADSIFVLEHQDVLHELGEEFHGPMAFVTHAFVNFTSPALYLAAAGAFVAWFLYIRRPELPAQLQERLSPLHRLLVNKYYFDWFNEQVLARATRNVAGLLANVGDQLVIDGVVVNGSARLVARVSGIVRHVQSGYLYHYAFAMIIGLAVMVGWLIAGA